MRSSNFDNGEKFTTHMETLLPEQLQQANRKQQSAILFNCF